VMLMRGHRFHAPSGGGAQVLDVTTYPEINDLLLASDAAVLDYSSLRFDVALTGKPMVFLVPDLRAYTEETRGFLYPFTDSAPGPLVETTEEVVAALRDVPALARAWAARIADFNATYQPLSDGHAAERVVAEFFAPLLEGDR
jgi:CDP-glycerol glycerophosphotransferase